MSNKTQEPPRFLDGEQATRRGRFLINLLYLAVWVLLIGGTVWVLFRWLLPFLLAFLTAALLQKPIKWLTARTRAPRGFLSGLLVVTVVLTVAGMAGLIGWWLWRSAVNFFGDEQTVFGVAEQLRRALDALQAQIGRLAARFSPETAQALQTAFGHLTDWGALLGEQLPAAAGRGVRFIVDRVPSTLFSFLVWVVASVFLTVDYQRVMSFFERQLPPHRRALMGEMRTLCGGTLGQIFRAYLTLMLLTFAELTVGLWLLRVPAAPLVAALIAVVDILPVLGVGTVLIPWAGVSFLAGSPREGMWLLVLYLFITVVRNVVEPRLLSGRVGLPPVVTLLCLYLGWRLAGVAGVLLFPLAATVLLQLHRRGHITLWRQ